MHKNIFLLLALFLFSGCAERGFKLSSHVRTHTATAESVMNVNATTKEAPETFQKMKDAVKKELNSQKTIKPNVSNNTTTFEEKFTEDELSASSTEDLIFKRTQQTYQKFGNSEIHGHVIYLTHSGIETSLPNSKIYLLAVNKTLNNWYKNAYLKNKRQSNYGTTVRYINQTYLNLSKNFAFHGIAPGEYFIIIVSEYPQGENKNEKVYIAKKIKVEKRKKIMAVFSKKL